MKIECLAVHPRNFHELADLDISKLDKVFLQICVTDEYFAINLAQFKILLSLDTSKIVLVALIHNHDCRVLREKYVPFKEWPGALIKKNDVYSDQTYNFINLSQVINLEDTIAPLAKCLRDDKYNIVLYDSVLRNVHEKLLLLGNKCRIHLVVDSKYLARSRYVVHMSGIMTLKECHTSNTFFQYIQLNDGVANLVN